jgi:hypothetical protein
LTGHLRARPLGVWVEPLAKYRVDPRDVPPVLVAERLEPGGRRAARGLEILREPFAGRLASRDLVEEQVVLGPQGGLLRGELLDGERGA